jgi:integrase
MTFIRKADAEGWLATQRADLVRGTWRPASTRSLTFREYAARWLEQRKLKPTTAHHYRVMLDKFLLPGLGDMQLAKIDPHTVRTWHARLDTGSVYKAHCYGLLASIMRTAADDGLITVSPCVLRGAGRPKRTKKIKPATLDELATIVAAMPPRYRLLVLFGAWCGLRFGELAELRRKDIDLKNGVICVRRGVTFPAGGGAVVGPPKSEAGIRDVHVPPHLLPMIREHLRDHAGIELLFPSPRGHHLSHQRFYAWWRPARDAAGRPDLRVHDLRHTGAVLAAQSGATLKELMARLGHSTPQMAMAYQHAAAERDKEIAAKLSALANGERR